MTDTWPDLTSSMSRSHIEADIRRLDRSIDPAPLSLAELFGIRDRLRGNRVTSAKADSIVHTCPKCDRRFTSRTARDQHASDKRSKCYERKP